MRPAWIFVALCLVGCQTPGSISAVPEEAFLPVEERQEQPEVVQLESGWMQMVHEDSSTSWVRACPELSSDRPRSRR